MSLEIIYLPNVMSCSLSPSFSASLRRSFLSSNNIGNLLSCI